jgi:DNA repair exonuclease SbcCD ATPase subunit
MADLNEALEEAVAACETVGTQSSLAREQLSGLVEEVKDLTEVLDKAESQVEAHFNTVLEKITAGESQLQARAQEALSGLTQLQSRTRQMEEEVQDTVQRTRSSLETLEAARNEILGRLDHEAAEKKAELLDLVEKIKALQAAADAHLDKAIETIQVFRGHVVDARDAVKSTKEQVIEQVDALEEGAKKALDALVGDADDFIEHGTQVLETMAGNLEGLTSKAVELMGTQIAESVVSALTQSVQPLEQAFDTLGDLVGNSEDSLLGKFGDIAEQVGEVGEILEKVKPVLDLVEEVL